MATSTDLRAAIEEVQLSLPGAEAIDIEHYDQKGALDELSRRLGAMPWWVISTVVHSVLFLLCSLLVVNLSKKPVQTWLNTDFQAPEKPKLKEPVKRNPFKELVPVKSDQKIKNPFATHTPEDLDEVRQSANDMDTQSMKGFQKNISDIPLDNPGVTGVLSVGPNCGLAGPYGYRLGGRKPAVGRFGGSKATESAVEAALQWLKRHQNADGSWSMIYYKSTRPNVSMTGLATLAFLGAGYTHKTGKYRDNVNRAVKWIISQQHDNGGILGRKGRSVQRDGYHHSMAAIALVEAYGMSKDLALKEPAQKSVDYTIKVHQKPYAGWRYRPGQEGDISHTGWFVMHLKSAKVAGLRVDGTSFQGGMNFVNKVLSKKSGRSVYESGQANATFKNGYVGRSMGRPARRTSISMVCRLFMGEARDSEVMKLSARFPKASPPTWEQEDFYYWYYATLAMFQMGGEEWKVWNKALKPTLIDNQRKGGPLDGSANDVDGSWDYEKDAYGKKCGRVYTTALGALCLEVYYRYLPMYSK